MASSFAATEKFRVTMQDNDGSSQRVTVQLSLDGLKILNQDGSRTMRSYNLRNVARWDLMDTSTVIWTKTDVDLEERALTLSSDSNTVRNVVDTLAMCCMQLAEIIQEKDRAAASNLEELASGGGKTKKAQKLPSVDSVEYWRAPDKAGWLQSQSEVIKMWRRRWFVLKQGYLFRFLGTDVSESVKPRGVVDLSKVQDVRDGRAVTGKANTVQLKTASGGSVCYVCESETEMVEWISALEGAIAKIVKQLAGVDDSEAAGSTSTSSSRERHSHRSSSSKDKHSSSSSAAEWAKQVERSMSQGASGSSSRRGGGGSGMNGSAMVSVVNYAGGGGGSGSGSGAYRSSAPPAAAMYDPYNGGGSGGDYGGISSYSQVSGAAGLAAGMDDLTLNYGGYPSNTPAAAAAAAAPSSSYAAPGPSAGSYSNNIGSYGYGGGSSSTANAYGGGGSSGAYGYSSSPAAATAGYGGSTYAADGSSTGMYGYGGGGGSSSSYSAPPPAAAGMDPSAAAGGVNGYAPYPQQQQQQLPAGYGYGDGAGYYQQQQAQQQQQQPAVSLLDQVPAQQPAYPYYQPTSQVPDQQPAAAAAAAAPPAPAGPSSWQVHHTAEGRPYYYNTATGTTQWEAPPGM